MQLNNLKSENTSEGIDEIKHQAAYWIDLQDDDQAYNACEFLKWIDENPLHAEIYSAMSQRVQAPEIFSAARNVQAKRQRRAIGAVIGISITFLTLSQIPTTHPRHPAAGELTEFASRDGIIRNITLSDGSKLSLAGGTRLTVRMLPNARHVKLVEGTIFAVVSRDLNRPFRVETPDATIEVLGTSFEVSRSERATQLAVASGMVKFQSAGNPSATLRLTANQTASANLKGVSSVVPASTASIASWRHNWKEYNAAPLSAVVADLNRFSAIPIIIPDHDLGQRKLSGVIRLTQPNDQLDNLAALYDFEVDRGPQNIVIKPSQ